MMDKRKKTLELFDDLIGKLIDTIPPKFYFSDQPELKDEIEMDKRMTFEADNVGNLSAKTLHEKIRLNPGIQPKVSDIVKKKFGDGQDEDEDDENENEDEEDEVRNEEKDEAGKDHVWGRKQKMKKEISKKQKMSALQKKLKEKIEALKQKRKAKDETRKRRKQKRRESKRERREKNQAKPGAKQKGFAKRTADGQSKNDADSKAETVEKSSPLDSGKKSKKPKTSTEDGPMMFNKIEFEKPPLTDSKEKKAKFKPKMKKTDQLKKTLKNIEKDNEKIQELKASGQVEVAENIKQSKKWKNALARSEGEKVKDNPALISKSIKKEKKSKERSAKKWAARNEHVEKSMENRQKKRSKNLAKVQDAKKEKKKQRYLKKGAVIF